jgi:hypothetical protein
MNNQNARMVPGSHTASSDPLTVRTYCRLDFSRCFPAARRKCDSPEQVRECFDFAFKNIKPTDATIVGMFPKLSDHIGEITRLVRELAA